jgi:hypothetical protein
MSTVCSLRGMKVVTVAVVFDLITHIYNAVAQ